MILMGDHTLLVGELEDRQFPHQQCRAPNNRQIRDLFCFEMKLTAVLPGETELDDVEK